MITTIALLPLMPHRARLARLDLAATAAVRQQSRRALRPPRHPDQSRRTGYVGRDILLSDGAGRTLAEPPFCTPVFLFELAVRTMPNRSI
jgi:hypothetical protein